MVVLALVLSSGTLMSTSMTATQAKIKTDWVTFFAGTTTAQHKVALLQNGQSFAAVINDQASNPMSKSSGAKVLSVSLTSKTQAKVRYTITLGGQPALSNQTGVAVLQGGTWKVGDQSFCALLALEQAKASACASK
jgi:CTP:molybdopterin cytidylyltransferase MocA